MNRDDLIQMARECGYWSGQTVEMNDVGLERFAALVAAAEREACLAEIEQGVWFDKTTSEILDAIAAAIRARGAE